MLRLLPIAILLGTITLTQIACGGSREAGGTAATDDASSSDSADVTTPSEVGDSSSPTSGDTAATASTGEGEAAVPSDLTTVVIVPGNGYLLNGKRATLAEIDAEFAAIAKTSRYQPVHLRATQRGAGTTLHPVLDLTEKHKLVNVSLSDGQ